MDAPDDTIETAAGYMAAAYDALDELSHPEGVIGYWSDFLRSVPGIADALAAGETLRAIEAIVARWWAVYPSSGMSLDCMEEIMKLVPPPSPGNDVSRPT